MTRSDRIEDLMLSDDSVSVASPRSNSIPFAASRKHGQSIIRGLWSQLAAVRCWERWKDFKWQVFVDKRSKLARNRRLQVCDNLAN